MIAQLPARVTHGSAIEIGAARSSRGRRVRHLVGSRGHDANPVERDAELACRDTAHLRVQALAHLGPAMVHLHAAIAIEEHQRARLIEQRGGEGDAELDGREREAAFLVRMGGIVGADLGAARVVGARPAQLVDDARDAFGVAHFLAVVRAISRPIEVLRADLGRIEAEGARDAIDRVFDDDHRLRPTEPPHGRVRWRVREEDAPHDAHDARSRSSCRCGRARAT